jgi:ADP-heptose:LPS heptosyltransferase
MSMNSNETDLFQIDSARVCVLFPGALGDFVCFLPTLRRIADSRAVDLLARSEFTGIAPRRVTVHSLERSEVRRLFIDDGAADQRCEQFFSGYGSIYSWFASQQAVFVDQLQKVSRGRARIFAFRTRRFTVHQADYYLSCLNSEAPDSSLPVIELRAEALRWCDSFCRRPEIGSKPLLIIAPGSGAGGKNWPEANFLQVAYWWREQLGGQVVVVIGPVEAERHAFEQLSSSCIVASDLDLAQLAALLARCSVYVGNDSGVSHLAAAVGARTVAIFGPSDERQWAPRGPCVSILRHWMVCSPCDDTALERCQHRACLTELCSSTVIGEMRKLLEIDNLTRVEVGITV